MPSILYIGLQHRGKHAIMYSNNNNIYLLIRIKMQLWEGNWLSILNMHSFMRIVTCQVMVHKRSGQCLSVDTIEQVTISSHGTQTLWTMPVIGHVGVSGHVKSWYTHVLDNACHWTLQSQWPCQVMVHTRSGQCLSVDTIE